MSTPRKQPKMNRYQLSKAEPIINSFEGFEEELDDKNNNIRGRKATSLPVFVARVNNFLLISQLLKKIAIDEYEIKIMNE